MVQPGPLWDMNRQAKVKYVIVSTCSPHAPKFQGGGAEHVVLLSKFVYPTDSHRKLCFAEKLKDCGIECVYRWQLT